MRRSIVARSAAAIMAVVFAAGPAATQTPAPPEPVPPAPGEPAPPAPVPPQPVQPGAPLTLPVTGTTSTGEKFTGNLSVHRFVARDSELKAVVTVTGAVADATGLPAGSFLKGLVETPVEVRADDTAPAPPGALASATPRVRNGATVIAQTPQPPECALVELEISGLNFNVLGFVVTITSPLVLYLGGDTAGGQLGIVVCQVVDSLNNVTSLAGLLNVMLTLLANPSSGV
jgi:hypothetical protein